MNRQQILGHSVGLRCVVAYVVAIGMSPCSTSGQIASRPQGNERKGFVRPVQAEMDAYSQIRAFGGSCVTDADGHIVEVDLVFSADAFGRKSRNSMDCADALDVLPSFPKLVSLKFPLASLSDAGLQKIGKLHSLECLRVADKTYFAAPGPANITDDGVKHLAGLSRLQVLQLQNTKLTDASMPTIGRLVKLTELSMPGNDITDAGIKELSELELHVVHLGITRISGTGLSHLAHMPIETLGLSHCSLIDNDAMEELRRFSKLKTVWLSATRITDLGLSRITNLPLEYLAIGQCRVTDECKHSIQQLESLRELHFHYTGTTDDFLLAVGQLQNLERVVISNRCTLEGIVKLQELNPRVSVAGDWRHETLSNLMEIGRALGEFEEQYGALPMTEPKNDLGKPLYSWRVAILPLLGEQELFDAFRLDEPWDSEHNIQMLNRIPSVYRNQNAKLDVKTGYTLLQAIVGEPCLLQSDQASRTAEALDGARETAIVISTSANTAVPWTAPQDYEVDLENPTRDLSNETTLTFVLFANGRPRYLKNGTDRAIFRAMYTRDGND